MAIQSGAIDRVLEDCAQVLKAIRAELQQDRTPYAVDLRRLLESALVLRFGEYLQFLEKFGFLKLDRRTDILDLTRPGKEFIEGKISRSDSLRDDAAYHFGERLNEIDLELSGNAQVGAPLDGRYLPSIVLGSGALSTVSLGMHLPLNKPIAIKSFNGLIDLFRGELTPQIRKELKCQIEDYANIESDFVLSVLDVNVNADVPYLISEFCGGGNLRNLMDREALPPDVALTLFHQACLGLKAAHDRGLVHGDLKPENLLLTTRGNLKLADLGFSQLAQSESLAKQHAYVGYSSLGYLAPEMFRQDRHYTVSSDIYSMGIILYELLVGRLPGRRSPLPSEVVEGLPVGIDDLFDRMASDDQDERIGTLDEVLMTLSKMIGSTGEHGAVSVFLTAPFTLPDVLNEAEDVQSSSVNEADDAEMIEPAYPQEPALEMSKGLDTVNASDLPRQPAEDMEGSSLENADKPQSLSLEKATPSQPDMKGTAVDLSELAAPQVDESSELEVDLRSETAVHNSESTSMLDSITEDPS